MSPSIPQKRCTKCGQEFPATAEYFHRSKAERDGFVQKCKICISVYQKAHYRATSTRKPLQRVSPEVKRQRQKERSHRHYKAHSDEYVERAREWKETNPDRTRQLAREGARRSSDKRNVYQKQWRLKNRDKGRLRTSRRRARQRAFLDTLTIQEWRRAIEYFNHRCAVCDRTIGLWHKLAADHWIPLSASNCPGTIATNIVPLCHGTDGCNNSKNNRDATEWLTERFGKRKARVILKRIEIYFEWVKQQAAE